MKQEDLLLMEKRQKAEFALSPIGQMVQQIEAIDKVAQMYAKSDLVPATFKGKAENCSVAINMAIRMKADPIMLMQNMYVVHGTPSLSSKMIIAMINNCGRFEPLRWEARPNVSADDPNFGIRAYTFRKDDPEHKFRLESSWVTNAMIKAEGWGPKWKSMPEQMFRYRTAVFWARLHAPEVTMGFMSTEEVSEPSYVYADAEDVTNQRSLTDRALDRMRQQMQVETPAETTVHLSEASLGAEPEGAPATAEPQHPENKPAKTLE